MAKFDVDVQGVTYEVDAPDEGTAWKWANATHQQEAKTSTPLPTRPANLYEPEEPSGFDKFVGKLPTSGFIADTGQRAVDMAAGLSGLMRGGANLLPGQLGDKIWPKTGSRDSISRDIGGFLDPVGLAVGGGLAKVLPYAPVLGKGIVQGAKAMGKNLLGGALMGGTIGALSEGGDAQTGAAIGAGLNVVLPPVIGGAVRGVGKLADALRGNMTTSMASSILKSAAGSELPAIQAAMKANPSLTPAQAAASAGIKQDTWYAINDLAKRVDKDSFFTKLSASQKQEVVDGLRKLAVAPNQTAAKQVTGQSKSALNMVTSPMRENVLGAAKTGGVDTDPIISELGKMIRSPSSAGSKKYESVLTRVAQDIDEWAAKNGGVIDAEALYAIRKNSVNDAVESLTKGLDPKASAKYAAKVLSDVRPMIDDAIDKASSKVGPLQFRWKDYLKTFEEGSRQIDQQKMGAKALDLFEKNPKTLESLAAGNEPKMVEKIFKSEYDLRRAMGNKAGAIEVAASYLSREREMLEGAARGAGGLERILQENIKTFKLPNWINAKIAVTNRALSEIESRVNRSTMTKIEAAMRSGASANTLLSFVPLSERTAVAAAILRAHGPITGSIVSGSESGDAPEQPPAPPQRGPRAEGLGSMGVRS